jgi:hypothetical protein
MSRLVEWLDHRKDVVGFEKWKDLSDASSIPLPTLREIQSRGCLDELNRSERRTLAGALRVSLRKLERLNDGDIDWIDDHDVYDAGMRGRPLPGQDDAEYWSPRETKPEDRGTPLIGQITAGGRAEPDEDWQEEWGRHIPQRFGKGYDIYGLEFDRIGHSIVLRNIPVWEFREGLAAVYCWNGFEAEGWFGRVYLGPSIARVVTDDGARHDLDLLSVVRIGRVVGRWPTIN